MYGWRDTFWNRSKGRLQIRITSTFGATKGRIRQGHTLGCEPENLMKEHATIVSLYEEGNMKNMYDKGSDF